MSATQLESCINDNTRQEQQISPLPSGNNNNTVQTEGVTSVQTRIDDGFALNDANLLFGDTMSESKPPETLRVYFQNANSICSEQIEKWLDACLCMLSKEVDIFGLAEMNVNPCHPGLTEEVPQIAK